MALGDGSVPPAEGKRLAWSAVPTEVRSAVETRLRSVVISSASYASGFSPGVASRLDLENGRTVFAKAIGAEPNPDSVRFHRREAEIVSQFPKGLPVPALLEVVDERGWVVLVFDHVPGSNPQVPWAGHELDRVLVAMAELSTSLTPSPLAPERARTAADAFSSDINGWKLIAGDPALASRLDRDTCRHIEKLVSWESAATRITGNTLVHMDLRADNILLSETGVWFVDWPHALVGPQWLDLIGMAPSVEMQRGPDPETMIGRAEALTHGRYPFSGNRTACEEQVVAAVVAIAGFFTHRSLLPEPPGLPTLRAFQAGQAAPACRWALRLIE